MVPLWMETPPILRHAQAPVTLKQGDLVAPFRGVDIALLPRQPASDDQQIVVLMGHNLPFRRFPLELWQLRGVPSTTDGLDQEDAGIHASPLNVDVIALIRQQYGLCRDDLQIVVNPALVPIRKQLE
jgi:hypothetical protein